MSAGCHKRTHSTNTHGLARARIIVTPARRATRRLARESTDSSRHGHREKPTRGRIHALRLAPIAGASSRGRGVARTAAPHSPKSEILRRASDRRTLSPSPREQVLPSRQGGELRKTRYVVRFKRRVKARSDSKRGVTGWESRDSNTVRVFQARDGFRPREALRTSQQPPGTIAHLPDKYQGATLYDPKLARAFAVIRRAPRSTRARRTARKTRATAGASSGSGGDDPPPPDSDPPSPALLRVQRAAQESRTLRSLATVARDAVASVAMRLERFDVPLSLAVDYLTTLAEAV